MKKLVASLIVTLFAAFAVPAFAQDQPPSKTEKKTKKAGKADKKKTEEPKAQKKAKK